MRRLTIDLGRMKAVQAASARERANVAACTSRINDAMAAETAIGREILAVQKRSETSRDSSHADRLNRLQADRQKANAAVLDASDALETARDRVSVANRLRSSCERYVQRLRSGAVGHAR